MNIVLCVNSKYIMPSVTCIVSILESNKGSIHFYILHAALTDYEVNFLENVVRNKGAEGQILTAIRIPSDVFSNLPIFGRSREAYFRLLIPEILPKDLDRCLYLDGDTIVFKSLELFYSTPFEGKALVVSADLGEQVFFHKERHPVLNIPIQYSYFNSGVLLWNLQWFREGFNMESVYKWVTDNPNKLKFLDQDVLNANFYDKVKYADGYLYNYEEILINHALTDNAMDKVVITHFLKKPWKYGYTGMNAKYWWKYGKQIYPWKYFEFLVLNFLYRKILAVLLIFVSVGALKRINGKLTK